MDRHRPSGASAMNARDPMSKQKMSNISEPGPLKRAQGRKNLEFQITERYGLMFFSMVGIVDLGHSPIDDPSGANSNLIDGGADLSHSSANSQVISLQDFELLKVIGRGSYAKVFLAEYRPRHSRSHQTGRLYAMKVIKKSIVNDDEDIDWIQCEKNVFEKATNHPFLVGLHSCFQTPSRLFFVIEFVTGGDLMYHMQRQRKLPESSAR